MVTEPELTILKVKVTIKSMTLETKGRPSQVVSGGKIGNCTVNSDLLDTNYVDDRTKVSLSIKCNLNAKDLIHMESEYSAFVTIEGKWDKKTLEKPDPDRQLLSATLPYISEMVAYITGRCDISPVILPPFIPKMPLKRKKREAK